MKKITLELMFAIIFIVGVISLAIFLDVIPNPFDANEGILYGIRYDTEDEFAYEMEDSEISRKQWAKEFDYEIVYPNTLRINNSIAQGDWWFQFENVRRDNQLSNFLREEYSEAKVSISFEELRKHFGNIGNEYNLALEGFKALKEKGVVFDRSLFDEGMPFYLIDLDVVSNMSFEERCEILGKRNFLSKSKEEWLSMTEKSIAMLTEQEWRELAKFAPYAVYTNYTLAKEIAVENPDDFTRCFEFQFMPLDIFKVLPAGEYEVIVHTGVVGNYPITLIIEEDIDVETMKKYALDNF